MIYKLKRWWSIHQTKKQLYAMSPRQRVDLGVMYEEIPSLARRAVDYNS